MNIINYIRSKIWDVYLFLRLEDVSFSMFWFLQLGSPEVSVVHAVGYFNPGNTHFSLCGDDVNLINTAQRATVQVVGA